MGIDVLLNLDNELNPVISLHGQGIVYAGEFARRENRVDDNTHDAR
jgi:hypothetical protein